MSEKLAVDAAAEAGITLPIDPERVEEAARHALREEGVTQAEVSIAFVGDATIAAMNEGYLAHEGATDVITFALHQPGEPPLGDIYIGVDQAARQAAEAGVAVEEELLRLAVHGVLHVLGYDHPEEGERESSPMYVRQEQLLATLIDRYRSRDG